MHDNHITEDQFVRRVFGLVLVLGGFIAIALILNVVRPAPPQETPRFYYPDPTPYVNRVEVNIGSHNCIGWNVNC